MQEKERHTLSMNKTDFPTHVSTKKQLVNNESFVEYTELLRAKYASNNRVLLVQSPQFLFESLNIEVVKNRGYYAFPPTGLQYLAGALSGRNLDIEILDLNYQFLKRVICDESFNHHAWLDILDNYLDNFRPYIVGVTAISVYADVFKPTFPLTSILKRLRDRDDCIVVAGGPTATNETENYLKGEFSHFIVEGEGENKINFLFDYLFDCRQTFKPTPGIYFKLNGKVEHTHSAEDKVALQGNLIDTYKLIPIEDYHNVGCSNPFSRMAGQDKPFTGIQLNRGCRANCEFCDVTKFMGIGLRQYPAKDILDDVRYLVKERGIRHFEILDDDFLGTPGFKQGVIELLKGMVDLRRQYGITWSAGNGLIAASLTEELLCMMRDSGCVGFRIGIESGNAEMQKKMKKPASLPLLRRVGEMLQQFPEIFVAGNYIVGFFGTETFGQMLDTFRFSFEMNLDGANFTVFQFTGKTTAKTIQGSRKTAAEFIPSKNNSKGEIAEMEGVVSGPEVFNIPKDSIPQPEQIKQIWFSFNLVANYINNKNLTENGKPEKLASWLEAVQISYPNNPYIALFAGLSYISAHNSGRAKKHLEKTKVILGKSEYWKDRFSQFGLNDFVTDFPEDTHAVYGRLAGLRKQYSNWIV